MYVIGKKMFVHNLQVESSRHLTCMFLVQPDFCFWGNIKILFLIL